MNKPDTPAAAAEIAAAGLRTAVVLRVREDACQVLIRNEPSWVPFAMIFPAPRSERVSPGHLVAVSTDPAGTRQVIWRWFDAVILGEEADLVRLWEPAHGEVLARPRGSRPRPPGTRAYLSAGLPGADWWLAGPVPGPGQEADVELDELARFFTDNGLWDRLG